MSARIIAAVLAVSAATGVSAQIVRDTMGAVSGAASAASRGGAGAVDPRPGSSDPTPSIVGGAPPARTVRVSAGARVQVTRETRCYDGRDYWEAAYGPDGYYYCEKRGPGATAAAAAGTRR